MISKQKALKHLMDLLRIEGVSGREGRVAEAVREKLLAAGCKKSWIKHDQAHRKIDPNYEVGNLIVRIPGTQAGPGRMLMGHMDTVPLCRGAVPVRKGNRIYAKGKTALGADNRTGVACLVNVAETLLQKNIPHPPLTLLFTIAEEVGLLGAKHVNKADLGNPGMAFNVDSGVPSSMKIGAIGADRWDVEILGRSSHAGVHPEDGVSAVAIAALAIQDVMKRGYFGKVVKRNGKGTSNVGSIEGGEATNQVTDLVRLTGESRSHNKTFLKEITNAYRTAFEAAAKKVVSAQGVSGKVKFQAHHDYSAFKLDPSTPAVRFAYDCAENLGMSPTLETVDGGLDANFMNQKGIPTITIGAGQHHIHTVDELIEIDEFMDGCRLAIALMTE